MSSFLQQTPKQTFYICIFISPNEILQLLEKKLLICYRLFYRLSEGLICAEFLQDPQNSVQILEDEPLTSNDYSGSGQFVQITPQRVKLKLRPGIPTTLTFKGNQWNLT